jgi:hypothetical protein
MPHVRVSSDHERRPVAVATRPPRFHLRLLGVLSGIVDLDPEVRTESAHASRVGVSPESSITITSVFVSVQKQ